MGVGFRSVAGSVRWGKLNRNYCSPLWVWPKAAKTQSSVSIVPTPEASLRLDPDELVHIPNLDSALQFQDRKGPSHARVNTVDVSADFSTRRRDSNPRRVLEATAPPPPKTPTCPTAGQVSVPGTHVTSDELRVTSRRASRHVARHVTLQTLHHVTFWCKA